MSYMTCLPVCKMSFRRVLTWPYDGKVRPDECSAYYRYHMVLIYIQLHFCDLTGGHRPQMPETCRLLVGMWQVRKVCPFFF